MIPLLTSRLKWRATFLNHIEIKSENKLWLFYITPPDWYSCSVKLMSLSDSLLGALDVCSAVEYRVKNLGSMKWHFPIKLCPSESSPNCRAIRPMQTGDLKCVCRTGFWRHKICRNKVLRVNVKKYPVFLFFFFLLQTFP